jgi:hypothetical protein
MKNANADSAAAEAVKLFEVGVIWFSFQFP